MHILRLGVQNKKHKSILKIIGSIGRRGTALVLLVGFILGTIAPPVSAYANELALKAEAAAEHSNQQQEDANKPMKQDYPAGEKPAVATIKPAADAKHVVDGSLATISKGEDPAGEVLQGVVSKPKITPHELTEKRTAASSTSLNADGSLTQRHYFAPKYFQKDGEWADIDTSLEEDKNAGDSGNIFGQALGQVESWFSSPTTFMVKDNDWQARFAPSSLDAGMVRIKKGGSQIGYAPVGAKDVAPVITSDKDGNQTVHYYDLWPGVNVEYTVESDAVKENIILKDKNATNSVSFKVVGATLEKGKTGDPSAPAYTIKGALNDEFALAPANLILNNFGFVSDQTVFDQTYKDGVVTVSVDESYLQELPEKAFPAVIDPTTVYSNFGTRAGGNYVSFKSDGYICYSNVCNLYAGSLYDSNNVLRWWRGAYFAPYDQLRDPNTILTNATLHLLTRSNESFWTGDWGTHSFQAGHATCLNSFNCVDGVWASASFAGAGDINLTSMYQNRIANGDFNAWVMVMGEDGTDHSFKNFDPGNGGTTGSYVAFTYGGPPSAPSIASPSSGQVYVDPQASFSVNTMANPNGSTPLKYEILVSTGSGATGGLVTSGLMDATQWTIPDGILQDGSTYYVQARSYDPITGSYSGWGSSVPFRIDLRTGKDSTQTYDNLGPVDVDLATGNVATTASSHTLAALGGSLGVSLDYNTPLKSRNGLVGEYWNLAAGAPDTTPTTTPVMTRVDQNVDFNWANGSPSSGTINNDWFYTRWTGYFVAPTTGTYIFGGNNDDLLKVYVNDQQVYINGGCPSGVCYGSGVSLQAGQVVSFRVEYKEATSPAYAHLYVKGAVNEQVVPQAWLQTGVRPVASQKGLNGSYYGKFDGTNTFSSANALIMKRTDPYLSFDWGTGAPMPNGPDGFLARWTGYITVPTSGTYTFGVKSDDGAKIMLGTSNTVVYNEWVTRSATESYGTGYALTANVPTPVTIEYFDAGGSASFQFKVQGAVPQQIVPSDWLSPKAQVLPDGWNLGIDPDGNINYDHVKINQNSAVLTDSTGNTHEYVWSVTGYKPPVNEDGQLVRNADGTFTLQDVDGRTYVFDVDGTLKSLTTPVDDRKPAALQYTYSSINGGAAALTQVTDAVDNNRWAKVYYSGDSSCGSAPSGFDTSAPAGMLCAVKTNDGRATYFYYTSGQLARVAKPGNEITDYLYEAITNSASTTIGYRMTGVRDVLANDAIAAGVRANDDTAKTQLAYDVLGRVISVTQPAATVGSNRIQHTIEYLPGALDKSYYGQTRQHVVGATEPNGFSRQVKYDSLFRTIESTDVTNLTAKQEWDGVKDLLYSVTDPLGLKSTTNYDDENRPTDSYGPAPAAWFGADRKPTTTYINQVPHTETKYDEGITGPAVAWYDYTKQTGNASGVLSGAPKLHTTGINTATPGILNYDYASPPITASGGVQGIGFSATGKLRLPNDTYLVKADTADGIRVWVDDQLVLDSWQDGAYRSIAGTSSFTVSNSSIKRLRIDSYRKNGSTGAFNVSFRVFNGTSYIWTPDLSSWLKPDYSLGTSTKTYDSTIGDVTATANYGGNPELGLAQSNTVDPTGLNLTTGVTYETQGASGSFLRQTSKTLPGGGTTNYAYYTATETKDNPCTTGTTEAYKQAGFIKQKTEVDPDGAGSQTGRVSESIYDDAGRTVASRYNTDSWTCATYDTRGRVTQTVVPTINGRTGRTVTTNYAYQGSPLKIQVVDNVAGTTVSEIDLLGRAVSATDTFGNVSTASYDSLGRVSSKTTPVGTESYTYDTYSRVTEYLLGGTKYATITYDAYSRVQDITYDQSKDASNNKLKLEQIKRDALQRNAGAVFRFSNGAAFDESVTRTQSGIVSSYTDAFGGNSAGGAYTYDKAGRLTAATVDTNTYNYGYGAPSGCTGTYNPNANKNSNRTSFTANGTTTTYCYDQADRLLSSSDTQLGTPTYDDHGNTVTLAGNGTPLTFTYDASDSNTAIEQGANKVTYLKTAGGSVLRKKEYTSGTLTKSYRYLSGGAVMQTCSPANDNDCTTTDTYLSLPGGVTLTIPANSAPPASTVPPSPWLSANVGGYDGTSSVSGNTFTLASNAYDIWGTNDQSHMLTQALNGDGEIVARVVSQTDTDEWAKAGLIIKDAHNEGSDYASVMATAGNGLRMEYNYDSDIYGGSYTFPNAWLKLVRSGNTITTYKSTNGTSWTQIGSETVTLPNTTQIGLFVLSGNTSLTSTAVFDNVSVTPATSSTLPSGWTNGDVGNPSVTGSSSYSGGTFTLTGAGTDVWEGDDQFQYAYKTLTDDGQIVARLTSQTNTNAYAKAGIVIKESPTAGATYASVHNTAENGTRMHYNFNNSIHGDTLTVPMWFKLTRSGNTITGYTSTNGTSWTQISSTTLSLPNTVTIGLYVSSVNPATASTATFDNVTITGNTGQTPSPTVTYSIKNFHGDTAITVDSTGLPTSSVYLYEPYGQQATSTTFNTNSNPTNATDQSMGWAASPTRKVAGAFTIPIIQMGARVYLPTAGRFLQVDPIEGGTPNSYVYATDPINFNDYSGKATCGQLIGAICGVLFQSLGARNITPQGPLSLPVANTASRQTSRARSTAKKASPAPRQVAAPDVPGFLKGVEVEKAKQDAKFRQGPGENFNYYRAGSSAVSWYTAGLLVGGVAGCAAGALLTAGAVGAACIVYGGAWAGAGGLAGASGGFFLGGYDSPHANDFDWGADQVINPWTIR